MELKHINSNGELDGESVLKSELNHMEPNGMNKIFLYGQKFNLRNKF